MEKSKSKVALLTNACNVSGIETAKLLVLEGFKVAITGSDQSDLNEAIEEIGHGALGLLDIRSDLGGMVPVYKKVTCYFNSRIDFFVVNTTALSGECIIDVTNAFFAVQYALPYLNIKASVLFNANSLTKRGLSQILSYPDNPTTGIRTFWGERPLSEFVISYN